MSTKIKLYLMVGFLLMARTAGYSQGTVELPTFTGPFAGGSGPVTTNQGPITMSRDLLNNNVFAPTVGTDLHTVTMSLVNQQYSGGMPYSNIQTGLVFGAQPTPATGGTIQMVDPGSTYTNLGDFIVSPGGPTDNMYTVAGPYTPGTGIVTGASFGLTEPNGAVFLFTNAQWQYNRPGGPSVHNSTTRYYYGDLVINFNRFVLEPVIHVAGLGGSYRYLPVGAPNVAANYLSTFFSTELEVVGHSLTKLSGNAFLSVAGSNITNNAAAPSGASVSTTGGLFDEIGAASGSVKLNGILIKTITIRIYLRGSNASNFPWSALGSLSGGSRNPLTGDIWGISVSSEPSTTLLPSTGLNLTAALNDANVSLKWKTQTEINSKEFLIERSTDGVNFMQIGSKAASGNTSSETSYSHVDPNMNVSVYYYRIRQIDLDGKFSYSNIVTVRKGGIRGVRAFPNPAVTHTDLEFSNMKGAYTVSVFNSSGQEVNKQTVNINSTVQYVTLTRNNLPTGMYSVSIKNADNSEVYTQKILFQ